MSSPLPSLCLASVSPRRATILSSLGLDFRILPPLTEEAHPDESSLELVVKQNALAKAKSVLGKIKDSEIALGADTLVVLDGKVLGKPTDRVDAKAKLDHLSGRTHTVITGMALTSKGFGERTSSTISKVTFKKMSGEEIESYLGTKEPYDKAGAYGIQGLGALFISNIEGSYTNVMGLPIETLLREMEALTKIPVYRWF